MQKITPHLWFDKEAQEAAKFYTSIFSAVPTGGEQNSRVGNITRYTKAGFEIHGQPEGTVMTVEFQLAGQDFIALNGGTIFKFTPAISFLIACESKEEVEALWEKLIDGGKALMELGEYPFSEKYGWLADRYGLSWQIMFMGDLEIKQKITPTLMFVGDVYGKAEEAMNFYISIFENSKIGDIMRYGKGQEPDKESTITHAGFTLENQEFAAMDSAYDHKFTFTEAISFLVQCEDQQEIDHYWKLTEGGDPNAQQCGWLKDKFGVSWQIAPSMIGKMLQDSDKEKVERVTNAFMKMKKLNVEELQKVYEGK